MIAQEAIREIMKRTDTSLNELAEYSDLGAKQNVYQMLSCQDLKVGTFVKMLETMGYQLVVQNTESDDEIIIDNEED